MFQMHFATLSFVCVEVYYNASVNVILHICHYIMSYCFLMVTLVGTQISHMSPSKCNKLMLLKWNFFSYRLFSRINEYSTILRVGKLTHEFIVDAWATTEQTRLCWVQMNQRTLQIDVYQRLVNTSGASENKEIELQNLGCRVILLSSFLGNACNKFEIFQNSRAIT